MSTFINLITRSERKQIIHNLTSEYFSKVFTWFLFNIKH